MDRGSKDYGNGVALKQKKKDVAGEDGDGLIKTEEDEDRRSRESDAAHRRGDADEDEEENSDDGGSESEEDEEKEAEEKPVMRLLCFGRVIGPDDYMLICSRKDCGGQAAHRSCTSEKGHVTPRGMRRSEAFLNAAKDWVRPVCQYWAIIFHSEDSDVPGE